MEKENKINKNELFLALISSLASTCWMQLGKVPNPITNKIEQDLENAQVTIEMLRVLKEKTQGNLTPEEERFIVTIISDLELNFADEVKKQHN